MRAKKPLLTAGLIGGYFLVAFVILAYLAGQASGGAISLTPDARIYKVQVAAAPGVNANKSEVVNPAGVSVGVVTSVELTEEGATLGVKVTNPEFTVYEDGDAEVVTKTILGEKAVILNPGESDNVAEDGATLIINPNARPFEPSQALDPLAAAVDKIGPIDTGSLLAELRKSLIPVLGQLDSMVADVETLSEGLDLQSGALQRVGTRTAELVSEVSARDADIVSILQSLSVLTAELSDLVVGNLGQIEAMLGVVNNLSATVAGRQAELDGAIASLPGTLDKLEHVLNEMVLGFRGEPGHYILSQVNNLPVLSTESVQCWIEILDFQRNSCV